MGSRIKDGRIQELEALRERVQPEYERQQADLVHAAREHSRLEAELEQSKEEIRNLEALRIDQELEGIFKATQKALLTEVQSHAAALRNALDAEVASHRGALLAEVDRHRRAIRTLEPEQTMFAQGSA